MDRRAPAGARLRHLVVLGLPLLAGMIVTSIAEDAWGRPGGGQSYRGGRSGGGYSGGGGGGGDAWLIYMLFQLIFRHPIVGIPLAAIVLYVVYTRQRNTLSNWDGGGEPQSLHQVAAQTIQPRAAAGAEARGMSTLRAIDPDFSEIVLRDFVYRLYASLHLARGDHAKTAALRPYLSEGARTALEARDRDGARVTNVVIGAMSLLNVRAPTPGDPDPRFHLQLRFESNLSLEVPGGRRRGVYCVEVWTISRAESARSRAPDNVDALGCPNCGAPFTSADNARCDYCGEVVADGRFDWQVTEVRLLQEAPRPPALGGYAEEVGTLDPLVRAPDLDERWAELSAADPEFQGDQLHARVQEIFTRLNEGWTQNRLEPARPYVSEGMYDYLRYWVDTYQSQGLRNVLEETTMDALAFAKVTRDRYYDAITVRVWGSGLDYTIDEKTGRVVGGHKRRRRRYSEYWTLIRSSAARGPARTDETCPNCGAGLSVGMGGACNYCGAHVTGGEFDWVLATIEQDEAYRG